MVVGAIAAMFVLSVTDLWHEYLYIPASRGESRREREKTNSIEDGYVVVPNQTDPYYLRRGLTARVGEQLGEGFNFLQYHAEHAPQRVRYAVESGRCGRGTDASQVEVEATPDPAGGQRYSATWHLHNDCPARIIVNRVLVTAHDSDGRPMFNFDHSTWAEVPAGATGMGTTWKPGYWSREVPARMSARLTYGYTR